MIHGVIQKALIAKDNRVQFLRNSEYHMKIGSIKNIFFAGIDPFELRQLLTHGTAPVAARIVMDLNTATLFTYAYICT